MIEDKSVFSSFARLFVSELKEQHQINIKIAKARELLSLMVGAKSHNNLLSTLPLPEEDWLEADALVQLDLLLKERHGIALGQHRGLFMHSIIDKLKREDGDDTYIFDASMDSHVSGLLDQETDEAVELRDRLYALMDTFEGFDDVSYQRKTWSDLLEDMKLFEKTVCNFEILIFFYGYMARTALNAEDAKTAICYAKAGESICRALNDEEGIRTNQQILCDIAASVYDFKIAKYYFCLANPSATPETDESLEILTEIAKSSQKPTTSMALKKQPPSFKFVNTELGPEEKSIRTCMKLLCVSRAEAKRYGALAKNLVETQAYQFQ